MNRQNVWPWILLGAAAPWVIYFNDSGGNLWMTVVALSGLALAHAIPSFRRPIRSNPWGLLRRDGAASGFSHGLFFGGGLSLVLGLFADSTLTADMGAILVWMGALHRVHAITAESRKRDLQEVEAVRAQRGAA